MAKGKHGIWSLVCLVSESKEHHQLSKQHSPQHNSNTKQQMVTSSGKHLASGMDGNGFRVQLEKEHDFLPKTSQPRKTTHNRSQAT